MNINRFGEVKNGKMILNDAGKMVEENLLKLPKLFNIGIDIHVVMPNHIHVVFAIENYKRFSVGTDFYICPNSNNSTIKMEGQKLNSVPTNINIVHQLSISEIIQRFKIFTTNLYIKNVKQNNWMLFQNQLWQRSFYDHVIRVEESLDKIREYILNNPAKWELDKNNPNKKPRKYYFEY